MLRHAPAALLLLVAITAAGNKLPCPKGLKCATTTTVPVAQSASYLGSSFACLPGGGPGIVPPIVGTDGDFNVVINLFW